MYQDHVTRLFICCLRARFSMMLYVDYEKAELFTSFVRILLIVYVYCASNCYFELKFKNCPVRYFLLRLSKSMLQIMLQPVFLSIPSNHYD